MNDFHLTPTASPRPAKPACRQSSLSQLALATLAVCGQMTKPELVAAMVARRKEAGRPAHSPNIYARLKALVAAGQIESRRMDCATWLSLPESKPGKRGKRQTIRGHAIIRRGKIKFTTQNSNHSSYSGNAVLTYLT